VEHANDRTTFFLGHQWMNRMSTNELCDTAFSPLASIHMFRDLTHRMSIHLDDLGLAVSSTFSSKLELEVWTSHAQINH
jgi:hypothetical protein